jgi:mRNA-degrading endonuclease RelE of RelBE toxin-antitoxin system
MSSHETFWNIRFTAVTRRMYSEIPRGETDQFTAAVTLLRRGPNLPGAERIGENLYQYRYNDYRIAFEIVAEAVNTVRITAFENEAAIEDNSV